nr:DUF6318 family protein [Actinomyces gaoshouyii]
MAYFFTLYRHAFVTGDTTDLAAMSEEGCVFCRSTIDDATKLHKDGGWANPWTITLHDLSYIPPDEGKEYSGIKGKVDAEASTVIKGNGEVVEKSQETISMFVAMKYVGGGWVIKGVSVE